MNNTSNNFCLIRSQLASEASGNIAGIVAGDFSLHGPHLNGGGDIAMNIGCNSGIIANITSKTIFVFFIALYCVAFLNVQFLQYMSCYNFILPIFGPPQPLSLQLVRFIASKANNS